LENKFKILSAGLITGAVFVIFLYSPIGSPDLYRSTSLYTLATKPGVNFEGKPGHRSSKSGSNSYQPTSALDIQVNNTERRTVSMQGVNNRSESFELNSGSGVGTVYSTSRSVFVPAAGGDFILSGGASRSSSGRISTNDFGGKGHGFIALNSDIIYNVKLNLT